MVDAGDRLARGLQACLLVVLMGEPAHGVKLCGANVWFCLRTEIQIETNIGSTCPCILPMRRISGGSPVSGSGNVAQILKGAQLECVAATSPEDLACPDVAGGDTC
ncbi:uncharacterized protein DS421_19g660120 [Arachis hypogaea]|uniref:Secreted protein n=1 Tax=Arachis hypogaea TaxID=3818 RepID=A0A6B9VC64_ARAHY|nr:uncharacterized protein DS421_19g660120 [Arachis hypogaea]